jgi:hypothetical protein
MILTPPGALQPTVGMLQTQAGQHDQMAQTQTNGAEYTAVVWEGNDHNQYQRVHTSLAQHQQANADEMRSVAQVLLTAIQMLELILTLVSIARVLFAAAAALAAAGFFTFGASEAAAADTAAAAVETQASSIAASTALKAILKAAFEAFLSQLRQRAIGTAIGAGVGLSIGVTSDIQHGRSGWDAVLHPLEDMALGAGAGFELSAPTPWTGGGVAFGIVHAGTDTAANGFDLERSFDDVAGDTALFTGFDQTADLPTQGQQFGNRLTDPMYSMPNQYADAISSDLQNALPPGSQGRVTMGTGIVQDADGNRYLVIGTSEPNGYIRPSVRPSIPADAYISNLPGHAEDSIVQFAQQQGWQVISVGAGRPICQPCEQIIVNAGGYEAIASNTRSGFIPFWMR